MACCHGLWRAVCLVDHVNHKLLGVHYLRAVCRPHDRHIDRVWPGDECFDALMVAWQRAETVEVVTSPPKG